MPVIRCSAGRGSASILVAAWSRRSGVAHAGIHVLQAQSCQDQGPVYLLRALFLQRWGRSDFPEYDLETDEWCAGPNGPEIRRESVEIGPAAFVHHPPRIPRRCW